MGRGGGAARGRLEAQVHAVHSDSAITMPSARAGFTSRAEAHLFTPVPMTLSSDSTVLQSLFQNPITSPNVLKRPETFRSFSPWSIRHSVDVFTFCNSDSSFPDLIDADLKVLHTFQRKITE